MYKNRKKTFILAHILLYLIFGKKYPATMENLTLIANVSLKVLLDRESEVVPISKSKQLLPLRQQVLGIIYN